LPPSPQHAPHFAKVRNLPTGLQLAGQGLSASNGHPPITLTATHPPINSSALPTEWRVIPPGKRVAGGKQLTCISAVVFRGPHPERGAL
jgi:hypothetical protein